MLFDTSYTSSIIIRVTVQSFHVESLYSPEGLRGRGRRFLINIPIFIFIIIIYDCTTTVHYVIQLNQEDC